MSNTKVLLKAFAAAFILIATAAGVFLLWCWLLGNDWGLVAGLGTWFVAALAVAITMDLRALLQAAPKP